MDNSFDFKLLNMKFGLTGYVNAKFTSDGMKKSEEQTAITFYNDSGKRALSLPIDRHNYTFRLVRSFSMPR